jgi:hypothetical protein
MATQALWLIVLDANADANTTRRRTTRRAKLRRMRTTRLRTAAALLVLAVPATAQAHRHESAQSVSVQVAVAALHRHYPQLEIIVARCHRYRLQTTCTVTQPVGPPPSTETTENIERASVSWQVEVFRRGHHIYLREGHKFHARP